MLFRLGFWCLAYSCRLAFVAYSPNQLLYGTQPKINSFSWHTAKSSLVRHIAFQLSLRRSARQVSLTGTTPAPYKASQVVQKLYSISKGTLAFGLPLVARRYRAYGHPLDLSGVRPGHQLLVRSARSLYVFGTRSSCNRHGSLLK